jgi:hypothetical protein
LNGAVPNQKALLEDGGSSTVFPGKLSFIMWIPENDVLSKLDLPVGGEALAAGVSDLADPGKDHWVFHRDLFDIVFAIIKQLEGLVFRLGLDLDGRQLHDWRLGLSRSHLFADGDWVVEVLLGGSTLERVAKRRRT